MQYHQSCLSSQVTYHANLINCLFYVKAEELLQAHVSIFFHPCNPLFDNVTSIVSFECADDPSIHWLQVGCGIWGKGKDFDVLKIWYIFMASCIVNKEE